MLEMTLIFGKEEETVGGEEDRTGDGGEEEFSLMVRRLVKLAMPPSEELQEIVLRFEILILSQEVPLRGFVPLVVSDRHEEEPIISPVRLGSVIMSIEDVEDDDEEEEEEGDPLLPRPLPVMGRLALTTTGAPLSHESSRSLGGLLLLP